MRSVQDMFEVEIIKTVLWGALCFIGGFILLLVLADMASCQTIPDTPQPQYLRSESQPSYTTKTPNARARSRVGLAAIAGAVVFEQAAAIFDATETERGLRAGVAVEGNTFLVGSHPSFKALEARDAMYVGLCITPSMLGYIFHRNDVLFGGLVAPVTFGVKHIYAARQWRALLGGAKPTGSELQ